MKTTTLRQRATRALKQPHVGSLFARVLALCGVSVLGLLLFAGALPIAHAESAIRIEPLLAEVPPVVESIDFEVRVTYRHATNFITQVMSNRVYVDVVAARRVELIGDGNRTAVPGGIASFLYKLTNTGNVVDSFTLTESLSDATGLKLTWWYDVDGSGRYGPGDIPVQDHNGDGLPDTGPLSPGASVRLLLVIEVEEHAALGVRDIEIQAQSLGDLQAVAHWESRLEVSDVAPYITLQGGPDYVYKGEEYVLPVYFGNEGSERSVEGAKIVIPLPPGVEYVSSYPPGFYDPVRHAVVWEIGTIPPGYEDSLYVTLRVQEGRGGGETVVHRASLHYGEDSVLEAIRLTQLVTRAPSRIEIFADPNVIRADGVETSRIYAAVVDMVGRPVDDGTVITFEAPLGQMLPAHGGDSCEIEADPEATCVQVVTQNGIAWVDLLSPKIDSDEFITIPVTVSAWNPDTGHVFEQLLVYFSPGAIVGRLIDLSTNLPEAGVEVRLIRLDEQGNPIGDPIIRYTDENGYYIFPVPQGRYRIVVVREGHEIELPQIDVDEAFDSITFAPITVRGRLVDRATGEGLADAIVDLFDERDDRVATTVTDEEGNFLFIVTDRQPANQFRIEDLFQGADFTAAELLERTQWRIRARTADGRAAGAIIDDIRLGDMRVNLELFVDPLGRVYDLVTGQPIPDADVSLLWAVLPTVGERVALPRHLGVPQPNPARTDEEGTYRFYVEPGYYTLHVSAPGYREYVSEAMVIHGNQVAQVVGLIPMGSDLVHLSKQTLNEHPRAGESVGYALQLTNVSVADVLDLTVVDWLPAEVIYVDGSANGGALYDPVENTLTWQIDSLELGRTMHLHYEVKVDDDVTDGTEIVNQARAFVDGDPDFATATSTVLVANWPTLSVTKEVDQEEASIGDVLRYRIAVQNRSEASSVYDATLTDRLPIGFAYVAGTTLIDGVAGPDPQSVGEELHWELGELGPDDERIVEYAVIVTLEATGSDGVNRAAVEGSALGGYTFRSETATARTRVSDGLFGHTGRILGRVYVDLNGDGVADPDEPGLEGVEVILDDGRRAVTGAYGLYTLSDINPGMRSVKLVATSLPHGVGPKGDATGVDALYSGQNPTHGGWSQFATVYPGSSTMVDFGVAPGESLDIGALPLLDQGEREASLAAAIQALQEEYGVEERRSGGDRPLHALPRIVDPVSFAISYRHGVTVTIEGDRSAPLTLWANGEPVPENAIGRRVDDPGTGLQELTYYGVQLQEGLNRLTAVSGEAWDEIYVIVVGKPHDVMLIDAPDSVPYRAERHVPITLYVTDALDLPVEDGTYLSLFAEGARVLNHDENPTQPGVQLVTRDGRLRVDLGVPGDVSGPIEVRVVSGTDEWSIPIETRLLPEPRVLVGTASALFTFDGTGSPLLSGSFYYRQGWEGDRHLALRYRTDVQSGEQPVLATLLASRALDTSVVDDLAPSSDALYLRAEWGSSHVLYGDFSPSEGNPNRFTQRTGRATGLEARIDTQLGQLSLYQHPHLHTQERAALPGTGLSGLYYLPHVGIVEGSEEVSIVAYDPNDIDREQPLESRRLRRGAEYDIDYRTGGLLFREPVPTYDGQFRRVYIEVTYAVDGGTGRAGGAYGLRHQLPSLGGFVLALSYTSEYGESADRPVIGLDGRLQLRHQRLDVQYTLGWQQATDSAAAGQASAWHLNWHPWESLRLNVRLQHVAGEFEAPGSEKPLNAGWTLASGLAWQLSEDWTLAYQRESQFGLSGDGKHSDQLNLSGRLAESLSGALTLTSRGAAASPLSEARDAALALSLDWSPTERTKVGLEQGLALSGSGEKAAPTSLTVQQQLSDTLAATLNYQRGAGSARHGGLWVLSLESSPVAGPQLYGRYRLAELDSASNEVILGLRDRWELVPGLFAGVRLESLIDEAGGVDTTGSLQVEWVLDLPLRLHLQHEFRLAATGERQETLRLGADGSLDGLKYELGWAWMRGGKKAADGRVLQNEGHATVAYRDPELHRSFVVGELVHRSFLHKELGHFGSKMSHETLAMLEGGYRVTPHLTLTAKLGWKQSRMEWMSGTGMPIQTHVALQQLGGHYDWEQYTLQAFLRRVHDDMGNRREGFAVEVVRLVTANIGIGLGFSSLPLDDPDLRRMMEWPEGVYARLVVKF